MNIFAFTDTHGDLEAIRKVIKRIRKYKPDVILCAGDFTLFGQDLKKILLKFDRLGKKFFVIHGNHEDEGEMRKVCKKLKNIEFIHRRVVEFSGVYFVGYGGGGFSYSEAKLESLTKRNKLKLKGKTVVFLAHQPVFNTKTDVIPLLGHRGSKSARRFVEQIKPKLTVCGHLHDTFNEIDKIKKSVILNPGPWGKLIRF